MLVQAIEAGLAHAAHTKGFHGSQEELAQQAAAAIASDMVLAGRGDEVLRIYASVAPAEGEEGKGKGRGSSWLSESLAKLPGVHGASPALDTDHQDTDQEPARTFDAGAPDSQSEGESSLPTFSRQVPLLGGAEQGGQATPGTPPYPPHQG